jgi:hypothetical protein
MTRRVKLPDGLNVTAIRRFSAPCEGAWQSLPPALLAAITADQPRLLIKFGLGLLRVPPATQLAIPILSYHHGDPSKYRGRPAGFYELLNDEPTVGQVIQILSNDLDSGEVVAFAETRAIAHSYRATLVEAYRHSPLLLGTGIRSAIGKDETRSAPPGPAYRLPGNATVVRFIWGRARRGLSRIVYAVTREKRWSVATVPVGRVRSLSSIPAALSDTNTWTLFNRPPGYCFMADPFPHPEGGLLVEGMNARSRRGEILRLTEDGFDRLSGRGGHFSYPSAITLGGATFIVPEVSDWSPPLAYRLHGQKLGDAIEIKIPGSPRLLDPTPYWHDGRVYLFANVQAESPSVLRLWIGNSLGGGGFVEHPGSPIRISPNGSRMGGSLLVIDGELIRVGQDLRGQYGDGVSFFRITTLDPECYEENMLETFRFADRRGPHTLNLSGGQLLFDFYHDAFSLLAGYRRMRERRAARHIS